MTRFGPDFGRTFDSTFGPFLSVFAISAICLNLKQPRLEECPRGDDAALASGPFVDQYRGRELLLAAYFAGFRPILWGISSDPGHIKS